MRKTRTLPPIALALLVAAGCDPGPLVPDAPADGISTRVAEGRGERDKKPKRGAEEPEPEPTPDYAWYRLAVADEADPLWRFGRDGDLVLLETDPTAAGWGTDYWGYWAEPFPVVGNEVTYTIGLTRTTYTFDALPDGDIDVTKTLVVQPYPSGEPTTTVTRVGVFAPEG